MTPIWTQTTSAGLVMMALATAMAAAPASADPGGTELCHPLGAEIYCLAATEECKGATITAEYADPDLARTVTCVGASPECVGYHQSWFGPDGGSWSWGCIGASAACDGVSLGLPWPASPVNCLGPEYVLGLLTYDFLGWIEDVSHDCVDVDEYCLGGSWDCSGLTTGHDCLGESVYACEGYSFPEPAVFGYDYVYLGTESTAHGDWCRGAYAADGWTHLGSGEMTWDLARCDGLSHPPRHVGTCRGEAAYVGTILHESHDWDWSQQPYQLSVARWVEYPASSASHYLCQGTLTLEDEGEEGACVGAYRIDHAGESCNGVVMP